jgi:hypothetical protein
MNIEIRCAQNLDNPRLFGDFWTSGTDAGCQGKYRWCSLDRDFYAPENMWADGQPQNAAQAPNCAVLVLNNNSLTTNGTLFSALCSSQKRYICEVRLKMSFLLLPFALKYYETVDEKTWNHSRDGHAK